MFALHTLLTIALRASTTLAACSPPPPDPGFGVPHFYGYPPHAPFQCGKTDVYSTGLPPNHPLVIAQGYNASVVAATLAADRARILAAGYNLKTILQGPEQPISHLAEGLYQSPPGVVYDAFTVGFGLRGAPIVNLTAQFENTIALMRQKLPNAPFGFSISPNSTIAALQRVAPIKGNCSNTPGKDYGTYIYCNSTVCTTPYSPSLGTTYP